MIVTNVESVGIPFRKAQGGYGNPGFFRKGNDRLYLGIEEDFVESVETAAAKTGGRRKIGVFLLEDLPFR